MRIYKPRGITRGQIILVSILGVFSGVYIWRPLFDDYYKKPKAAKTEVASEAE